MNNITINNINKNNDHDINNITIREQYYNSRI